MAINFTVSYTFSPSTTISSSQVNTNFSDEANVWVGLEALTKTFAKLKVDVDPTTALEVATKQYVDHYSTYRRPTLQYNSTTVVNIETGINGTSGQLQILFPDGTIRTDSTTTRIQCNFAQVAALTGTAQSGLQTGAVANNTWYGVYAVKSQVNSTDIVAVASTVLPLQANFATLNTNFGASSWVYLGAVANGDNSGATTVLAKFFQIGNRTFMYNVKTGTLLGGTGIRLANTAGATSLTWTYAAGTAIASAQVPSVFGAAIIAYEAAGAGTTLEVSDSAVAINYSYQDYGANGIMGCSEVAITQGLKLTIGASRAAEIALRGWTDNVLGVGSNPIL